MKPSPQPSRWLCLLIVSCSIVAQPASPPLTKPNAAAITQLLNLIQQRLEIARSVAQAKWNSKSPIEDLNREEVILQNISQQASQFNLTPSQAKHFFTGQIQASKTIQANLHELWTSQHHPPFLNPPNLRTDIRPLLDKLTPQLLKTLGIALPTLQSKDARRLLMKKALEIRINDLPVNPEPAIQQAIAALLHLTPTGTT
jgi:chorismate mutase